MTRKGYRRIRTALGIVLGFFVFLFAVVSGMLIATAVTERYARTLPSYAREDISALLEKEEWTDGDYETIFLQTGVGRSAADALKAQGEASTLLFFQEELFFEGTLRHEYTVGTMTTLHDLLYEGEKQHNARLVPLEDGDVLVSSTCHTFGWRNGHAALVTDASTRTVMESVALGMKSQLTRGGARWFTEASNFMVLRLKNATAEQRAELAKRATAELLRVEYSLTVGLFSSKDQCENGRTATQTNCAHLVWQAYKNCGYDIDSNGGAICTVHNIAESDLFEVVQVYGFDPRELW